MSEENLSEVYADNDPKHIRIAGFNDHYALLEFFYLAGMHKATTEIASCLDSEDYVNAIREKYRYPLEAVSETIQEERISKSTNKPMQSKKSIKTGGASKEHTVPALGSPRYLTELKQISSSLDNNSKILEIGTYVGASTIALAQGAEVSNSKITSIDVYTGFNDKHSRRTISNSGYMHWEYNLWQSNVSRFQKRLTTICGPSISVLRQLVSKGEKFDMIFLDSSHDQQTHAELALISCLAKAGAILVLDDVIDYNSCMTEAWLLGLQCYLAFPRFTDSLAIAGFKEGESVYNFKASYINCYHFSKEVASALKKMSSTSNLIVKQEPGNIIAISKEDRAK